MRNIYWRRHCMVAYGFLQVSLSEKHAVVISYKSLVQDWKSRHLIISYNEFPAQLGKHTPSCASCSLHLPANPANYQLRETLPVGDVQQLPEVGLL